MNIAIFGATGGTGRQLLSQALDQGHSITALVRDPKRLSDYQVNNQLKLIQGDAKDASTVASAVEGQEAVICALGAPASDKSGIRTQGTKQIIQAMQDAGVNRLVCLSGFGAGDSHALLPFHYKYLIFPLMLRHVFVDHEEQEAAVMNSGLDWTLVRPGALTDGPRTGNYQHGFTTRDPSLKIKISRADVADFMLKQLTTDNYLHQTPALSY